MSTLECMRGLANEKYGAGRGSVRSVSCFGARPLLELSTRGLSVHGACVRSHVAGQLLCVTRARACGDTLPFPFFIRTAISNAPPLFARLYESLRDWRFGQFFTTQLQTNGPHVYFCDSVTLQTNGPHVYLCDSVTLFSYSLSRIHST